MLWTSLASPHCQAAGPSQIPQYIPHRWTTADHLPHNTIRNLLQDRAGHLWIATPAGLARFDGARFKSFHRGNTPEMASDNIVCLKEDRDGALWIGTESGLLRLKENRIARIFDRASDGPAGIIRYLNLSSNGVWVATTRGAWHVRDGQFSKFTTGQGLFANDVRSIFEDAQGRVRISTDVSDGEGGLQGFQHEHQRFVALPGMRRGLLEMTHVMIEDRHGILWRGDNAGLHADGPGGTTTWTIDNGLLGSVVKWIRSTSGSGLILALGEREWLPGQRGLQLFRAGRFHTIPLRDYGVEDDVTCAIEDREGNLWVGTRHDGLLRLKPKQIVALTVREGLVDDHVLSLCAADNDRVFATTRAGLHELSPEGKAAHLPRSPKAERVIQSALIYTGNGFLHDVRGRTAHQFDIRRRQPSGSFDMQISSTNSVQCMYSPDGGRTVYGGLSSGVILIRPMDAFYEPLPLSARFSREIRCILRDRSGTLWFGSDAGGLIRFAAPGLEQQFLPGVSVWALHEDSEGRRWAGTQEGLFRVDDEQCRRVTGGLGLAGERIHAVLEDDFGFLWVCSLRGIAKVSRRQLNDFVDGISPRLHSTLFDDSDGLPTSATTGGTQPVACKSTSGKLWFATPKGAVMIDPATLRENTNVPPVLIEQVKADGEVISGDDIAADAAATSRLSPGRGSMLEIQFTANSLSHPDRVRFKYRLHGHDPYWREPGSRERTARYTNLRPGEYRFQVIASNNHGCWNETGASYAFSLTPRFTQTIWFPISTLGSLALLGFGLAGWRLRWQRRALQAEKSAELASERARIARDLHDDLGASLSGLALELDALRHRRDPSPTRLAALSGDARGLAHNLREIAWATNPRCDNAASLSAFIADFAERFCSAAGLKLRLELDPPTTDVAVSARARHDLFVALKESLANTSRHARARHVTVRLAFLPDQVRLVVGDDGSGFDLSAARAGSGLANLAERFRENHGVFEIASQPGSGTLVTAIAKRSTAQPPPYL